MRVKLYYYYLKRNVCSLPRPNSLSKAGLPLRHFWRSKDLSRAEFYRPTVLSDLYLRGPTVLPPVKANVRYKGFQGKRFFTFSKFY
jgi:hypothetical protein